MKKYKREIVYFGILLFSIFLIYITFRVAFEDVILSQIQEKKNIFLLSFDHYVYLTIGLLLTGFTAYLYMHLAAYIAGKLFAAYLTCISIGVCLVAATNYHYMTVNILIGILTFLSNIFLYYSISYLTLIAQRKYFKWMTVFFMLITLVITVLYLLYMKSDNVSLLKIKDMIIMGDYIITIVVIILSMLLGYQGSTIYSKRQIRFLSGGLVLGIIMFLIAQSMPTIAIIKISENNVDFFLDNPLEEVGDKEAIYSTIQMENLEGSHNIYPIMIFSGMVIAMIYILIKREYFGINDNKDLKRYMLSTIYLIVSNTYFLIVLSENVIEFIIFNCLLLSPLFAYSYRMSKRRDSIYNNNMLELLEEERQKLSIFLHDEILQDLIALSHCMKRDELNERLTTVIGTVRNVSQDIYPTIVEDLGVEQALKIFIDDIRIDYNIELVYQYEYPKGVLPKAVSLVIYRTVKELVTNAIKHSNCTQIIIIVASQSGGIECKVFDNGIGFQVRENEKLRKNQHMGLYTIRKQISNLNGNMRIISEKTGSEFQIHIPLR